MSSNNDESTISPTTTSSIEFNNNDDIMNNVILTYSPTLTFWPTYDQTIKPSISVIPSTSSPTYNPSVLPTSIPSLYPSVAHTTNPSNEPSSTPSMVPTTNEPSKVESSIPSVVPTTSVPSNKPSIQISNTPSCKPSMQIISTPSSKPSIQITSIPIPSNKPSIQITTSPTNIITIIITNAPSTNAPSIILSNKPSSLVVTDTESPSISKSSNEPTMIEHPTHKSHAPFVIPVISSKSVLKLPSYQLLSTESPLLNINTTLSPTIEITTESPIMKTITEVPTKIESINPTNIVSNKPSSNIISTSNPSSSMRTIDTTLAPSINEITKSPIAPSTQPKIRNHVRRKPTTSMPTTIPSAIITTDIPSVSPITASPTSHPTMPPTFSPTVPPTIPPTSSPTSPPTQSPTSPPTQSSTSPPTQSPTKQPTKDKNPKASVSIILPSNNTPQPSLPPVPIMQRDETNVNNNHVEATVDITLPNAEYGELYAKARDNNKHKYELIINRGLKKNEYHDENDVILPNPLLNDNYIGTVNNDEYDTNDDAEVYPIKNRKKMKVKNYMDLDYSIDIVPNFDSVKQERPAKSSSNTTLVNSTNVTTPVALSKEIKKRNKNIASSIYLNGTTIANSTTAKMNNTANNSNSMPIYDNIANVAANITLTSNNTEYNKDDTLIASISPSIENQSSSMSPLFSTTAIDDHQDDNEYINNDNTENNFINMNNYKRTCNDGLLSFKSIIIKTLDIQYVQISYSYILEILKQEDTPNSNSEIIPYVQSNIIDYLSNNVLYCHNTFTDYKVMEISYYDDNDDGGDVLKEDNIGYYSNDKENLVNDDNSTMESELNDDNKDSKPILWNASTCDKILSNESDISTNNECITITTNVFLSIIHSDQTQTFQNEVKHDILTHINNYMQDNDVVDSIEFSYDYTNQTEKVGYKLKYASPDPNIFLLQSEHVKSTKTTTIAIKSVSYNEITTTSIIVLVSMIIIFIVSILGFVKAVRFYNDKKKGNY